jgi:act minimal PKS acyl carrier protein
MQTNAFTMDDLADVMRSSACWEEDGPGRETELGGVGFTELGLDSLALLEILTKVSRQWGVRIPDEAVTELRTPGELVVRVNELLKGA